MKMYTVRPLAGVFVQNCLYSLKLDPPMQILYFQNQNTVLNVKLYFHHLYVMKHMMSNKKEW